VTNQGVRISDISIGGCYVDSIAEVREGEAMFIKILMRDGEWLEVQGVLAHHSPQLGFGVRFVNLDEGLDRQIRSLIDQGNAIREEQPEPSFRLQQIDVTVHQVM
jgi:hypothetical protein